MPSAEILSAVLQTVYAAPAAPELWPQFLTQFTGLLGLSGSGILCHNLENEGHGFSSSFGVDPGLLELYRALRNT